ncbi:hypothetical protein EVB87_275 [Rhizobium phage RHph_N28_1]|nr:hypothetical protein EVB87_275 [Rhizobium phage RHph_N28_1]QIG74303.1 hypothetical protein EVC07_275 [Rhizobium phage RHph_N42]QIG74912.1 hypothetical protein EVC12_277 [Rhizobium phage RHph_I42]QXV73962.1 hypothetical protein [Rhizobium phage RHph_N46]
MAQEEFYLPGNLTGIATSGQFNGPEEDSEASVIYEHERCVAAWLEYTLENEGVSTTRRIQILPQPRNALSHSILPAGAKYRLIANVGNRGFFRGRIIY